MLRFLSHPTRFCNGLQRRDFLKVGALGMCGLTAADVLRARALAAGSAGKGKSVIMICLNGGPSHIDMYDMKPLAPREVRGQFLPIPTNVPGFDLCELMPRQAGIADKFAVVRSLKMTQPSHKLHEVYTGFREELGRPSFGSVVSRIRGRGDLPQYVSLSITDHPRTVEVAEQPTYLGRAHAPFEPSPASMENLSVALPTGRLDDRRGLLSSLDRLSRQADANGALEGHDAFNQQAFEMLTSPSVRAAFDIEQEPNSVRELYGPDVKSRWPYQFGHTYRGTAFLRARRLVEAGVPVVTLAPMAWDDHGPVNNNRSTGNIFERLSEKLPLLDRSLHALVTDLHQRGLDQDVLVVMWGEFGRTPRVNAKAGRDHWLPASFAWFAGGGLQTGQAIGATDRDAGQIVTQPYTAENVFATIYRHLGIDASQTFDNFNGRPTYLLDNREPIRELM